MGKKAVFRSPRIVSKKNEGVKREKNREGVKREGVKRAEEQ